MTTPNLSPLPISEHPITVKVFYEDCTRRFKLPLKELKAPVFPQKVSVSTQAPTGPSARPISYHDNYIGHRGC